MEHLATFHRHEERLPLRSHVAISVFECECSIGDPDVGTSAVLLLGESDLGSTAAPAGMEVRAAEVLQWGKAKFDLDPEKEEIDPESQSVGGTKLGGHPTWVQETVRPTCNECKKPMRFVGQLDGGDTGMGFGDIGMGYVFACEDEHGGKFVTQSS